MDSEEMILKIRSRLNVLVNITELSAPLLDALEKNKLIDKEGLNRIKKRKDPKDKVREMYRAIADYSSISAVPFPIFLTCLLATKNSAAVDELQKDLGYLEEDPAHAESINQEWLDQERMDREAEIFEEKYTLAKFILTTFVVAFLAILVFLRNGIPEPESVAYSVNWIDDEIANDDHED